MLAVPIGRIGDFVPEEAVQGAEQVLLDNLWSFMQQRVPSAVAGLPIAGMVESKLKSYPIAKVEEIVWRVSKKELVLIIYLGGFLGALVGSVLLVLESLPAGLLATAVFVSLSFLFINLKG